MPDETKTNENTTPPVNTPPAKARPQAPAKGPTPPYEVVTDAETGEERIVTGNHTRDAIIGFQKGKFMELGKGAEEALELAVKRGYEMVKDPPKKAE